MQKMYARPANSGSCTAVAPKLALTAIYVISLVLIAQQDAVSDQLIAAGYHP
jgi:hypothetical protein